jgi:hypothetical protein
MRKLRTLLISLLIVAVMMATAVTVLAQDSDEAPAASGGTVLPKGPSLPLAPEGTALFDNGPLVNSAGTGVGGADESVLQNVTLGMTTLGFGHQLLNGNRIADDFTVGDAAGWDVTTITFYAYQSGAGQPSTISGVNLQIWDGDPSDVASSVVWGDSSTNVMSATGWSGIYRVTESSTGVATDRAIMTATVDVNSYLPAGTYWLDWQLDGSASFSGPWAPPITVNGQTTTGNGLQFTGAWAAANDGGTTTQQGFPFVIDGNVFAPTDVSFSSFSGDATSNNLPLVIGLVVLTVLAGAIVLRRQMAS